MVVEQQINVGIEADLDETIYDLGYKLIEKQTEGGALTGVEEQLLNFVYRKIDAQITRVIHRMVL